MQTCSYEESKVLPSFGVKTVARRCWFYMHKMTLTLWILISFRIRMFEDFDSWMQSTHVRNWKPAFWRVYTVLKRWGETGKNSKQHSTFCVDVLTENASTVLLFRWRLFILSILKPTSVETWIVESHCSLHANETAKLVDEKALICFDDFATHVANYRGQEQISLQFRFRHYS